MNAVIGELSNSSGEMDRHGKCFALLHKTFNSMSHQQHRKSFINTRCWQPMTSVFDRVEIFTPRKTDSDSGDPTLNRQ